MSKETFVTGPINTVRLEGMINKQKKVLYVFFDRHMPVTRQTECTNIRSVEIKNYLIENFDLAKEKNITVDFMMEVYPTTVLIPDMTKYEEKSKSGYLWLMWKFVKQNFNIKLNNKKVNEIHLSKNFPNVKFHYVDFRELFMYDLLHGVFPQIGNYFDTYCWCPRQLIQYDVNYFIERFAYIDNRITYIYNALYDIPITNELLLLSDNKPIHENHDKLSFINIIRKIKTKYHNKDIQNKINNILNKEVKDGFDAYFKYNDEILTFLSKLDFDKALDNVYNFYTLFDKLYSQVVRISVSVVDLYFSRRFLDKSYITNAIVYTGAWHGCNHVYNLVKYFDFKITHASYIYSSNIKDVQNIVKKSTRYEDIEKYFIEQETYQCSDLSTFPEGFT
jgi:hypothetical protein